MTAAHYSTTLPSNQNTPTDPKSDPKCLSDPPQKTDAKQKGAHRHGKKEAHHDADPERWRLWLSSRRARGDGTPAMCMGWLVPSVGVVGSA